MPVIGMVGNKGGAGKTTLSVNIATGLSRHYSVAVVDADPQGSALQWRAFANNEAVDVYEASEPLSSQATELLNSYQYVIFDCPPSVHAAQTGSVLEFADQVLIPVLPAPIDLWAAVHIKLAITKAQRVNPSLSALLVINQLESRTTMSRLVRDALSEIGLPIATTALRRRAIYRNCTLEGKSIFDTGRKGADAVAEYEQLIEEVIANDY